MRKIINKTAATPVQTGAASKNSNGRSLTTTSTRRPAPKVRLAAGMASNFWRPIVQARLERDSAGQAGAGDATVLARAGARQCGAVFHG